MLRLIQKMKPKVEKKSKKKKKKLKGEGQAWEADADMEALSEDVKIKRARFPGLALPNNPDARVRKDIK